MKLMVTIFLSLFLFSCNDGGGSRSLTQAEQSGFSSRLNANLIVSGFRCDGGETTSYGNDTFICQDGEWLVTLDDINTCSSNGCTTQYVPPIVADLMISDVAATPGFIFYDINPLSPISQDQASLISQVRVRFDENGNNVVVFR